MLKLQLEIVGAYASKPTKLYRLILIVTLVQVCSYKVALMDETGIFWLLLLPVYNLTIFGYFFTYFLDNLEEEIT